MGFQGDVAGIGLGELLQGLARGGREGVLTLRGGRLGATIGVESGQLFLLPEPDEDPEIWRKRCERAWVKDPHDRIDILRMSEIAYATRLEAMFQLLDHEGGVHFKFEEGPLPRPTTPDSPEPETAEVPLARAETGTQIQVRVAVHCPGISVEFLLLEHARLSDECHGHGDSTLISLHDVPRLMEAEPPSQGSQRLWEECDGMSNLIEIADRLGLPIRQVQGRLQALLVSGQVRFADARELLVLAQSELKQNRFARAASRLSGWVDTAAPGTPTIGDAQLLIAEWNKGKLPVVLASMGASAGRKLLRKLENAEGDPDAAIQRWREMRTHHKHDPISEVRALHWRLQSTDGLELPTSSDLVRVARKFEEQGRNARAAVLLRAAASLMPEGAGARIELGVRMIAVDLVEDGGPWIIEACRSLIESNNSEKAAGPLRNLLTADPANREARALLSLARKRSASGRKVRRNSLVGLSLMLILSLGALVRVRMQRGYDEHLEEINAHISEPSVALAMLNEHFEGDTAPAVVHMRQRVLQQLMANETGTRDGWLESYEATLLECNDGDPLLGLKKALATTEHPRLRYLPDPEWPLVDDLLDSLCARLEQTVAEWGAEKVDLSTALHAEQRLTTLIDDLSAGLADEQETRGIENVRARFSIMRSTLVERSAERAEQRQVLLTEQRLEKQNLLLEAARMHNEFGDLERSVDAFHELVEMEGSETIEVLLAEEISAVERHLESVREARRLALEGDHVAAREALEYGCPNLPEHLLPWRIESHPSGARTRLPGGWERATPFTIESAFGERLNLTFELENHEPLVLSIEAPGYQMLPMSRLPDLWWHSESPVTALPLRVGGDYLCADRSGQVVRLSKDGPEWSTQLSSISGIARTPVLLSKRPGTALLLSEGGNAWFVDANTGATEGPISVGAPPMAGPSVTATGATATFVNGTSATWERVLEPAIAPLGESTSTDPESNGYDEEDEPEVAAPLRDSHGGTAGLAALHRSADSGTQLTSPWNGWTIEIQDEAFTISAEGTHLSTDDYFHVSRSGEWNFIAWEAPHPVLPRGRLWISDEAGLRAFTP